MPWLVSFEAWGEQFYPGRIDFKFTRAQNPGDLALTGPHRNQPINYGWAQIDVPAEIPNQDRIRYLVEIVLPLRPSLLGAGATEFKFDIGRFYSTQ